MERAGLKMPESAIATSLEQALGFAEQIGLPAIVRPAFTLGGPRRRDRLHAEEFSSSCSAASTPRPIGQILIDKSVIGWGEFELEVMRDRNDNVVIVCSIENLDPDGACTRATP
jgi:carbamoyl-phosphate synthase large subunit